MMMLKPNVPVRIAAPALCPVLLLVTFLTERHQVLMIQRDCRIIKIIRRQVNLMVNMHSRHNQTLCQANLA